MQKEPAKDEYTICARCETYRFVYITSRLLQNNLKYFVHTVLPELTIVAFVNAVSAGWITVRNKTDISTKITY